MPKATKQKLKSVDTLPDIQKITDTRGVAIDQVGISDLKYPIQVLDRNGKPFSVVAEISMSVHLPHHFKGTHMSRFLEVLTSHEGEITMRTLPVILRDLKVKLDAESAYIDVKFPTDASWFSSSIEDKSRSSRIANSKPSLNLA